MPVAKIIARQLENASWIRRMFEEGVRLKRERGADAICDFSLGNPDVEPPPAVLAALRRVAAGNRPGSHGYMPNPGYAEVRDAVAGKLRRETGLDFTGEDVFMTVGSAGACNVILKSILDPGDEVIVLMPFFPEYQFYISNHGGRMVPVETDASFLPDVERIAAAITPRTRAILLNTPNNPTGRVYPASVLRDLDGMLKRTGQPITVISDEPYKSFVYDGQKQTEVASLVANTAICNSWSKSLGLPGERIGYLALSPQLEGAPALRGACAFSNRILGFINAPAIWQRVMLESLDETIDAAPYEHKRNVLCDALAAIGYEVRRPEGSFYIFLKTPIPDDVAFTQLLADEGVLAVPGAGFGRAGYIRLSLTIPLERIQKSIDGFERAFLAAARKGN
ncbi:MAG: pyridoxal phosphate-dependent aminotransferase [Terracidiphilus sp.]|nr:pyridoxal phosphate-dependent aminotransferase [Terracidiphilus sp.]